MSPQAQKWQVYKDLCNLFQAHMYLSDDTEDYDDRVRPLIQAYMYSETPRPTTITKNVT